GEGLAALASGFRYQVAVYDPEVSRSGCAPVPVLRQHRFAVDHVLVEEFPDGIGLYDVGVGIDHTRHAVSSRSQVGGRMMPQNSLLLVREPLTAGGRHGS